MSAPCAGCAHATRKETVAAVADSVELQLLGGFRLRCDGVPVERTVPPRVQALIALLALSAGVSQRRERIAELFWPEASERQAKASMRMLLYDLRRLVPEVAALIRADTGSVTWTADGAWTLDSDVFERAAREAKSLEEVERAAHLYTGDLLPSCYDDWIVPSRERLRARSLDLLRLGASLAEDAHRYDLAVEYASRLVAEEPLHEEYHRALMRLQTLAGDPAAAVRTYHQCAGILQRELSVEPSAATREAYELLLRRTDRSPAAGEEVPLPGVRFVGRTREWKALQAAWRSAASGRPAAVLLIGEPGIGKTRLLEELQRWAGHQGIPATYTR
jgi:DNA-binding SARP family transcriptional activator